MFWSPASFAVDNFDYLPSQDGKVQRPALESTESILEHFEDEKHGLASCLLTVSEVCSH